MGLGKAIRPIFSSGDFHYSQIHFELDSFIEFLDLTNKQINDRVKKHLNEYYKYPEIDRELRFNPTEAYIKQKTLQLYYSSIIISIYSFLEQSLQGLCKVAEKKHLIKVDDISGNGIFQFRKYLEKVIEIDFTEMNDEWNEITKLNHFRNVLVHSSNHKLNKSESRRKTNSIKELKHIRLTEHAEYYKIEYNDDKLIRSLVKTIRSFLHKIYYKP